MHTVFQLKLHGIVVGGQPFVIAGGPPHMYIAEYIHRVCTCYSRYVLIIYFAALKTKKSQKWRPPTLCSMIGNEIPARRHENNGSLVLKRGRNAVFLSGQSLGNPFAPSSSCTYNMTHVHNRWFWFVRGTGHTASVNSAWLLPLVLLSSKRHYERADANTILTVSTLLFMHCQLPDTIKGRKCKHADVSCRFLLDFMSHTVRLFLKLN